MGWHAPGETQDLNQKPRLEEVLSLTSGFCLLLLKCRWFFGRVFSFPLVEEICVIGKETGPGPGGYG